MKGRQRVIKRTIKSVLLKQVDRKLKVLSKQIKSSEEIHYLLSFPGNDQGLIQALVSQFGGSHVKIGYEPACKEEASKWQAMGVETYPLDYSLTFYRESLQKLLKAKVIIVDNYVAFLGVLRPYTSATIFQIWHANGAIKTFGWEDHQTFHRGKEERQRFQQVYDAVDYYIVGSDNMGEVFKTSYHIPDEKILKIGLPRTDYYFDSAERMKQQQRFLSRFPESLDRKVVLYCPTYRSESQTQSECWPLNEDYLVLEKKHPHQDNYRLANKQVIQDFKGMSLSEVLFSVDILITDYSSIPFEYHLARPEGNIYLYWYDADQYQTMIGLQKESAKDYQEIIVEDTEQLIQKIEQGQSNSDVFKEPWNHYNDGHATHRLIQMIQEIMDKDEDNDNRVY